MKNTKTATTLTPEFEYLLTLMDKYAYLPEVPKGETLASVALYLTIEEWAQVEEALIKERG